ncbi:MAG: hypothetical protein ABR538_12140, partial [Candidatus Binatia bacterium]
MTLKTLSPSLPSVAVALGLSLALGLPLAGLVGPASAAIDLPRPSPAASVSQRVGLTDVSVEYFSPAVKD